ncbi:hypothetical protein EMIT0194P_10053 [Pseudomonas serbica]
MPVATWWRCTPISSPAKAAGCWLQHLMWGSKRQIKQHCVFPMLFRQHAAAVTGSDIEVFAMNEDEWWERNWKKHKRSVWKNLWRTVFRLRF